MKVLVATLLTQGQRANDHSYTVEGELVFILPACRKDADDPDGPCGCGRSFAGVVSARATTTARIADLPDVTGEDYIEALAVGLQDQGYPADWAPEMVSAYAELASGLPVGAVLERRLDYVQCRALRLPSGRCLPLRAPTELPAPPAPSQEDAVGDLNTGPSPDSRSEAMTITKGASGPVVVLPEQDLDLIRSRSEARRAGSSFYVEVQVQGRDVTLVECRRWLPRHQGTDGDWHRRPGARLRYLRSRGAWQLFWTDDGNHWHVYQTLPRSADVGRLLDEIDADPEELLRWWSPNLWGSTDP